MRVVLTYLTDRGSVSFLRQKVRAQKARKIGLLELSASFLYINFALLKVISLLASLQVIEEQTFEGCPFSNVMLSDGVTQIAGRAFADGEYLKHINIPVTTVTIDDHAFDGVRGLTIHGTPDSYAETFAYLNGFDFSGEKDLDQGIWNRPMVSQLFPRESHWFSSALNSGCVLQWIEPAQLRVASKSRYSTLIPRASSSFPIVSRNARSVM